MLKSMAHQLGWSHSNFGCTMFSFIVVVFCWLPSLFRGTEWILGIFIEMSLWNWRTCSYYKTSVREEEEDLFRSHLSNETTYFEHKRGQSLSQGAEAEVTGEWMEQVLGGTHVGTIKSESLYNTSGKAEEEEEVEMLDKWTVFDSEKHGQETER